VTFAKYKATSLVSLAIPALTASLGSVADTLKYMVRQKEHPNLGRVLLQVESIYSGEEYVIEQQCMCRFQCIP